MNYRIVFALLLFGLFMSLFTAIKEGDKIICRYGYNISEDDGYGIISYAENEAMFVATFESVGLTVDFDHLVGKRCEVVGSIYERDENYV